MKHYICLEENQITYAGGMVTKKGFHIAKADLLCFDKADRERELKLFAVKNNLAEKQVFLALDFGIFFGVQNVPKTRPKRMQEMAAYELEHSIDSHKHPVVCSAPFGEDPDGEGVRMLTYAILEKDLREQLTLLKRAGLICKKAYILTSCMGQMAGKLFPDYRTLLLVEAGAEQIRILLIEAGCCILTRTIRSGACHYRESESDELLFHEISDQVSNAIQFYRGQNRTEEIEAIVLISNHFFPAREAAETIRAESSIPCIVADIPVEVSKGLHPEDARRCHRALAVMAKHQGGQAKTLDFLSADCHEWDRGRSREQVRFWCRAGVVYLISGLFIGGAAGYLNFCNNREYQSVQALKTYVADTENETEYQKALTMIEETRLLHNNSELLLKAGNRIQNNNLLNMENYQAVFSQITGTMTIRGMRYNQEKGSYELDIGGSDPKEFSDLIERIRQGGQFAFVTYDYWKQTETQEPNTDYVTTVVAAVRREQTYETE